MKNRELIEKLQAFDPTAEVEIVAAFEEGDSDDEVLAIETGDVARITGIYEADSESQQASGAGVYIEIEFEEEEDGES